jgi:PTH1 family peptidyl-tRNA hydrolase
MAQKDLKLIVGLGNVGKQYRSTRHNMGFMVVDELAERLGARISDFKPHGKAAAETLDLRARHSCILVKPTTMMNLSGQAVGELQRFYKVELENIWVIYDDVDLLFGQLRTRHGGSSGGHNGVRSVIQHIGENFWRVRLGVANAHLADTPTDRFVLDEFNSEEKLQLSGMVNSASDELLDAVSDGLTDHTRSLP